MLTPSVLYRNTLPSAAADLFTSPGITVVRNILITSKVTAPRSVTLLLDGVEILYQVTLDGKGIIALDINQVLPNGAKIRGNADAASAVNAHISGTVLS